MPEMTDAERLEQFKGKLAVLDIDDVSMETAGAIFWEKRVDNEVVAAARSVGFCSSEDNEEALSQLFETMSSLFAYCYTYKDKTTHRRALAFYQFE